MAATSHSRWPRSRRPVSDHMIFHQHRKLAGRQPQFAAQDFSFMLADQWRSPRDAWNLLKRAGDRVVAAAPVQSSGYRHEMPDLSYNNNMKG
jgi:hypothetical protein